MLTGITYDRLRRYASVALGTVMLAALLATTVPFETLASGQMCTLACCAGRAPHAAGSCMDGSCHALLKNRAFGQSRFHHFISASEQFCGLTILRAHLHSSVRRGIAGNRVLEHKNNQIDSKASVSAGTIGRPCEPNCGAGILSSSRPSRPRHSTAIAHATKPRPPSISLQILFRLTAAKSLSGSAQQFSPRGPPIPSS